MSDYEDDSFENYDDDLFLSQQEEDTGESANTEMSFKQSEQLKLKKSDALHSNHLDQEKLTNVKFESVMLPSRQKQLTVSQRKYLLGRNNRAKKILRTIVLAVEDHVIWNCLPMQPYDIFLRKIMTGSIKHQGLVFPECIDRSVQTENESATLNVAVQHPEDSFSIQQFSSAKQLNDFIHRAGATIEALLNENSQTHTLKSFTDSSNGSLSTPFSSYIAQLDLGSHVFSSEQRTVICSCWRHSTLMVAYTPHQAALSESIDELPVTDEPLLLSRNITRVSFEAKCLIAIYNISQSNRPQELLYTPGMITSISSSLKTDRLIYAGLDDGSLVVWDLHDELHMHRADGLWLRGPSLMTSSLESGHVHSVLRIFELYDSIRADAQDILAVASADESFQLASVDCTGQVLLWSGTQLKQRAQTDTFTDLSKDLSSSMRLTRTLEVFPSSMLCNSKSEPLKCLFDILLDVCMKPGDNNQMFFAFAGGSLLRKTRFVTLDGPVRYLSKCSSNMATCLNNVPPLHGQSISLAIAFCPFLSDYFLSAYSNGTICLHNVHSCAPIRTWQLPISNGKRVLQPLSVCWSLHRPAVFAVLLDDATLMLWDLVKTDLHFIASHQFKQSICPAALSFSTSTDSDGKSLLAIELRAAGENVLVLALEPEFSVPIPDEVSILQQILIRL